MSNRDASTIQMFPNGEEYPFRLAWGQLIKLEEERNCGCYKIWVRLCDESWTIKDISEVIFLGLVGGGMGDIKARKLVREYVEGRPPIESLELAQKVIEAGLIGAPEEPLETKKEEAAAGNGSTISPTAASASAPSTAQVQ